MIKVVTKENLGLDFAFDALVKKINIGTDSTIVRKSDKLSIAETFESISKNLKGYPCTLSYTNNKLTVIEYTVPDGTITKTLSYSGDELITVVLSGDLPIEVSTLTKTLTYTNNLLSSISYS